MEKRKWQLAFRRYVLEGTPSEAYAPYFGIDRVQLRKWFELQFTEEINWETFASNWQFDHVLPVAYFDFTKEEDLILCWNFVNIRVEGLGADKKRGNRMDVLAVKKHFNHLFQKTGYTICQKMLEKIERIETSGIESNENLIHFLSENKTMLADVSTLTKEEFARYNEGTSIKDLQTEREILKKFG